MLAGPRLGWRSADGPGSRRPGPPPLSDCRARGPNHESRLAVTSLRCRRARTSDSGVTPFLCPWQIPSQLPVSFKFKPESWSRRRRGRPGLPLDSECQDYAADGHSYVTG